MVEINGKLSKRQELSASLATEQMLSATLSVPVGGDDDDDSTEND